MLITIIIVYLAHGLFRNDEPAKGRLKKVQHRGFWMQIGSNSSAAENLVHFEIPEAISEMSATRVKHLSTKSR